MGEKRGAKKSGPASKLEAIKNFVFGGKSDEKPEPKKRGSPKKVRKSESSKNAQSSKAPLETKRSPKQVKQSAKARKSAGSINKTGRQVSGGGKGLNYFEGALETVCREVACEGLSTSGGYCRLHYIKNWKKIKRKEVILQEKKLDQYIEELVAKYPDRYIEAIRLDLASDKEFSKVIRDLDLDEGVEEFDAEGGDSMDSLIDSIKRDFEDESEVF